MVWCGKTLLNKNIIKKLFIFVEMFHFKSVEEQLK